MKKFYVTKNQVDEYIKIHLGKRSLETLGDFDVELDKILADLNKFPNFDFAQKKFFTKVQTEIKARIITKGITLLTNMNWGQLRDDKEKLISLGIGTPKLELDGLINLIDAIQDYAVDDLNVSEVEVFNFNKNE